MYKILTAITASVLFLSSGTANAYRGQSTTTTTIEEEYSFSIETETRIESSSDHAATIPHKKQPKQHSVNDSSGSVEAQPHQRGMTPHQSTIYVAMGDSIAAGAGLSGASSFGCSRSNESYPYIIAQQRNMQLIHLACSGATTEDVLDDQLNEAFARGTPGLITLTVGANDMQWLEFMRMCASGECGTKADTQRARELRKEVENRLGLIFDEIERRSGGNPPTVIVTGYSNPVSNYCKGRQDIVENKEINWLNSQRNKLNATIRKAMRGHDNVEYASTNFNGHALCSPESYVQGLNDRAPLHPNVQGQQLIAESVADELGQTRLTSRPSTSQ